MATETAIKNRVLTAFRERGHYAYKIHGEAMQERGLLDISACVDGMYWGVELKRRGLRGSASELQKYNMEEIRKAGGMAGVLCSLEEVEAALDAFPDICPLCLFPMEREQEAASADVYGSFTNGSAHKCPTK